MSRRFAVLGDVGADLRSRIVLLAASLGVEVEFGPADPAADAAVRLDPPAAPTLGAPDAERRRPAKGHFNQPRSYGPDGYRHRRPR